MLKFAAALVAGLASATALAADLPNGNASPSLMRGESAYSWSGIYAGASVGHVSDVIEPELASRTFGATSTRGFIGGLQVGFNKQAGALVVGLEADFSLSNANGVNERTVNGLYGNYALSNTAHLEGGLSHVATVRARLGYAVDNWLVYGTGGYAHARNKLAMSGTVSALRNTIASPAVGSASNSMGGWAAGGGIEYAFARGMSVKAEYLRVHLSPSTFWAGKWAESETRARINILRTGLNFRI